MKTRIKIIFLLASLLSVLNAEAASITYVKECKKMNSVQLNAWEYAKKVVADRGEQVALPSEIFAIIGNTTIYSFATLLWDDAYFKKENDWKCTLVIPLKTKTPIGLINSYLYIRVNNRGAYHRIIITSLPTKEYLASNKSANPDDNKFSGYAIHSNIDGEFIRAFYYINGNEKKQIEGLVGNKGVIDSKTTTRYSHPLRVRN